MYVQIMLCVQGAITVFLKHKLACKIFRNFSDMTKDEVVEINFSPKNIFIGMDQKLCFLFISASYLFHIFI